MIDDLLRLLKIKNRCLERILLNSQSFGKMFQNNIVESAFEERASQIVIGLTHFEKERETLIRAVQHFDIKIESNCSEIRSKSLIIQDEMKKNMRTELSIRDELIEKILEIDADLIVNLENEKEQTAKEIQTSRRAMDVVSRFKSGSTQDRGEGLDWIL